MRIPFVLGLALALVSSAQHASAQTPAEQDTPAPVAPPVESEPPPEVTNDAAPEAAPTDAESEVTIVGARLRRTPGSAHVLKKAELDRIEQDDPQAVLQRVPGVYVRHEDGVGLRPNIGLRGVNADRSKKVTLLEDGILFGPAPYSAPAAYYFPLFSRMTELRVIKGPGAIAYGPQTVGGAIDFITRKVPARTEAGLDLAFGDFGYGKAHGYAGSNTGDLGLLIEGVHLHNDGFKELPNDGNTGSTRNEWMVKTSYLIDPDADVAHELRLKLGYFDEVSNESYLGLADVDFRENPYQRYPVSSLDQMKNHRTSIVASHVLDAFSPELEITTSVYRHDFYRVWRKVNRFRGTAIAPVLEDPEDPSNAAYHAVLRGESDSLTAAEALMIGPNDRNFVSQGLQSIGNLRADTGPLTHRLQLGARLHYDSVERKHSEQGYLLMGGELVPEGTPPIVNTANDAHSLALALHLLDALTWEQVTLTPGVRLEVIQSESNDALTGTQGKRTLSVVMPGVGVHYAFTEELGVLAGVYRGFSPPPPGSSTAIKPEHSWNYEFGGRFTHERARTELIAFVNDYQNLTDVCTVSNGCVDEDLDRQFDAGNALIYGFEAMSAYDAPIGELSLPLRVVYTLTHAEFRNDFESEDPIYGMVQKGDAIPYVPRHQLNASVGIEHALAGAFGSVTYVSPMRDQAGHEPLDTAVLTDDQLVLDLGATLRPYEHVSFYVNLHNALDARDIVSRRPYGARPNAPRWLHVGLKLEL